MPWKNGLGTTREIAAAPPGASLDTFAWRISVADVAASGPFSVFPGCDRVIVQLEGPPMTLTHEGRGAVVLGLLEPHAFAGELATRCDLAAPTRDFNVMLRRGWASADVTVRVCTAGDALRIEGGATTKVAYVHRGAATFAADGEVVTARAGDAVLAEGPEVLALTAGDDAVALLVAIDERP